MRFVHAADIHLDSPLTGLARYEGAPVEAIRGATRRALENLVQLCLDEDARLLLIAGDLYDGDWPDYNTGLFFVQQMARLTQAGISVVLIRGNHDAANRITRRLPLPEGCVDLATRRPQTQVFEALGIAVHGQGYARQEQNEDLAAGYPPPLPGLINIGLLHTALEGRPGHAPYAPTSRQALMDHGYDYWALGHVHAREVVCEDPWIVFPGNLQGRHVRETGPKGATLVTVREGRITAVEHRTLDVVRWARVLVDAAPAADATAVLAQVREALAAALQAAGDRLLAVRVEITGASAAHGELARDPAHWQAQIQATALDLPGEIWLEQLRLGTQAPAPPGQPGGALNGPPDGRDDPVADLVRGLAELADDPQALAELTGEFRELVAKLPRDYRQAPEALDLEDPDTLAALIGEVQDLLLARLLDRGEGP